MLLRPGDTKSTRRDLTGDFALHYHKTFIRPPVFLNRNMAAVLDHHAKRRRNGSSKRQSSPTPVGEGQAQNQNDSRAARSTRHNLRDLNARNFNQGDHELQMELRSLRRRLNFKQNLHKAEEPARKRTRREDIDCQAFLAVWDNREGFRTNVEPIFKTSQPCRVIPMGIPDDNPWTVIEMDQPFKIKAKELFVPPPSRSKQPVHFGIGDNYRMEIKIIPSRASHLWPPIPLLNKCEGSLNRDMSKHAPGYEEGLLVASYANLPEPPPLDAPLHVNFARRTQTFKTKYCVEIRAEWNHPSTCLQEHVKAQKIYQDPATTSEPRWLSGNESDGGDVVRMNGSISPRPRRHMKGEMDKGGKGGAPKINGGISKSYRKLAEVQLSYRFDMVQPDASQHEPPFLDTVKTQGLCCPFCRSRGFRKLQRLRLHLSNDHDKYRFDIEKQEDDIDGVPASICFKVGYAEIDRQRAANHVRDERDFAWLAPKEPFNIDDHLDGDTTWVGAPPRRRTAPSKVDSDSVDSPFRPTSDVPPLVRNLRPPPRVPKSKTRNETPLYRSISHQIAPPGEALSESDDEIGKEWLSLKHADTLDPTLSDASRGFLALFDAHIIFENLANTKYLSDAVVRFTRANKEVLREPAMLQEFSHVMAELIDQGLTGAHVLVGCISIIQGKDEPEMLRGRKVLKKSVIRNLATDQSTRWGITQGEDEDLGTRPPLPTIRSCNKCHEIIRGTKASTTCSNTVRKLTISATYVTTANIAPISCVRPLYTTLVAWVFSKSRTIGCAQHVLSMCLRIPCSKRRLG